MSLPARPAGTALRVAEGYARQALTPATLRAYRADWEHFCDWCRGQQVAPLPAPPERVAAYLASTALTHARATLRREIMGHTRHRDLATRRGYVRRAKLMMESPAKKLGLQPENSSSSSRRGGSPSHLRCRSASCRRCRIPAAYNGAMPAPTLEQGMTLSPAVW